MPANLVAQLVGERCPRAHTGSGATRGGIIRKLLLAGLLAMVAGCASPQPIHTWGACDYNQAAAALKPRARAEMDKPLARRSRDAGVTILDYAAASLAAGQTDDAQRALYQAILLTNDMTLHEARGNASLVFDEALKTWQGEAYERAMIELLHGICLMQQGDFENARVAFDRAIISDRFSKGALVGTEGTLSKGRFEPNADYGKGTVFQRDFLAAYVLRTLCYLQHNRLTMAEKSWAETKGLFEEICSVTQETTSASVPVVWTGKDGRYAYPTVYLPPFRSLGCAQQGIFSMSLPDLAEANLVVVAATGSRPRKVKVGSRGYGDVKFVHDDYLPPAETLEYIDVLVDGTHVGMMTQCLNLFGQAVGRGPSAKDLAQRAKKQVEDIGELLEDSGIDYVETIGTLIRIFNREEADIRQWMLLPNAVHIWLGKVEPGSHTVACLATGRNVPNREVLLDRVYASTMQTNETTYLSNCRRELEAAPEGPLAARHRRIVEVDVPDSGIRTVFVAEQYNAHVKNVAMGEPRAYELLPRQEPPKQ